MLVLSIKIGLYPACLLHLNMLFRKMWNVYTLQNMRLLLIYLFISTCDQYFPLYFWYTIILLYMFVYDIFMNSPLWLAVGPQSL